MPFPYTFPFLFGDPNAAQYVIEVDWNADGDFGDTYDDISADVKSIGYSRGKDSELGKASPGTLQIRVNNSGGKYSPSNTTSVLNTGGNSLLPKRTIRVRAILNGYANSFYGFIESITPHPDPASQDAYISAIDGLDFLARHELDTILYKDTLTGALVTGILDSAGWSATLRSIDDGQDTVPYAHWSKVKARFALQDIEDSELGFIIIDGAGNLRWEDRHHRYSATHQTSQATFNDTMVDIAYDYSAKNIYNEVRATVTPWEVQALATLWELEETPSLDVGETKTWWGDASVSGTPVFVDAWTTPLKGTDYIVNSEEGGGGDVEDDNVTVDTDKFAKSIKIAITNDATHVVYITTLQARGTPYDDQTKVSRKSEDATSQTAYQKRTLALDGKYLTSAEIAQDFCDYGIARFKDPQAEVSLTILNKNNTNLTQILSREISDRITVQNTKLGLDSDFYINKMTHEITHGGKVHRCTWGLVDAENEDFWCLGHSELGVGTKLGY